MMRCYIGLGSNLDDSQQYIRHGIKVLSRVPEVQLVATSKLYQTAPVGGVGQQADFVNTAIAIDTTLSPSSLLLILLGIEQVHGRVRDQKNGPRTLDMDLLLIGDQQIDQPGLTVPHPRMLQRAFVMVPLSDIAPELIVPGQHQSVSELANKLLKEGQKVLEI